MREASTSHLDASVTMRCASCGGAEQLPRDRERRVLAMRALLLERTWAADAASGPALAYLKVLEGGALFLAPYLFGGVLVLATMAMSGMIAPLPIGVLGGAGVATAIALRVCRGRLRRTLVPLIRAIPAAPGCAQRCRRCGGDLPRVTTAFVTCGYCQAPNLASQDAIAQHAATLRAETSDALLYAASTREAVDAAGRFVQRALTAAFLAGAGGGAAIALAIHT
jgi:hypothetical protein